MGNTIFLELKQESFGRVFLAIKVKNVQICLY